MQEILIRRWCDRHRISSDEKIEASNYTVTMGALGPREIDLCPTCASELIDDLTEVLTTMARPVVVDPNAPAVEVAPKRRRRGAATAAVAALDAQPELPMPPELTALAESTTRGLGGRPRTVPPEERRGASFVERPGGFKCPLCSLQPSTNASLDQHLRVTHKSSVREVWGQHCPLCAQEFTVLGVHVRAAHGQPTVWYAFQEALRQGDPHGIVAARGVAWGQQMPLVA